MWTDPIQPQYARAGLALTSDLTDAEWSVLEPFFPGHCRVGRPRKLLLRRTIEAILHLLRGGLPTRMVPPSFLPVPTVRRWFYMWHDNGLWPSLNHALLLIGREAVWLFFASVQLFARRKPQRKHVRSALKRKSQAVPCNPFEQPGM